jgi:Domain of unknown function (DUF4189)
MRRGRWPSEIDLQKSVRIKTAGRSQQVNAAQKGGDHPARSVMTTNNTAATRRRITAAALLVAAGAMTVSTVALAAPASAVPPPATCRPAPNCPGPYLAIAWSPDNGDHGWANARGTLFEARDAAIGNCQHFGGDQCQVVVVTKECGALFAAPPAGAITKWGPANVGTGATPDAAEAAATDPSKVYDTGIPLIIRCATGNAGQG